MTCKVLRDRSILCLLSISCLAASSSDLGLVEAAKRGDKDGVASLLKQHADVNAAQADGTTALDWAAHQNNLAIVELLIRAGAKVNAANYLGVNALSLACSDASATIVDKLLQAGADPNATQRTGETALMTCAETGNVGGVISLLARGADVNAQEARRGQTALMWAVARKHPDVARALIEHGADVHARSKGGFTALLFAAQQGDVDSVRPLLSAGVSVNETFPEYGSALVVASASGNEEFSIYLLEKGSDPNAADGYGYTALHYAVLKGIDSLSGERLKSSRSPRPNMPGLVASLLTHGATPNAQVLLDHIPFSHSSYYPSISMIGTTPFLLAAAADDIGVMRALVAGGANPLLATREGITPLMVAAGVGRVEERPEEQERRALDTVKLALELGNDVNASATTGETALHGAAYTGTDTIIQFLVDRGARVNVKNRYGQTPLVVAEGDPELLGRQSARYGTNRPYGVHSSSANLLRKLAGAPTP